MKPRILVVDDDAALAEMLTIVLRGEGFEPFVVGDGTQALTAVREIRPDLVLLDLMLPGMNGIDVCRVLRADSGVPIVMLTAKSDTVDVVLGLESGADDYMVKPFKPKELVARVRARLRRTDEEPAELLSIGPVEIDVPAHKVTRDGVPISLTPLEFDLLVALARKPRQVFTRDVLLEQVWGYRHPADTRLVNVHVQRLRAKVETDPENPEVVLTVRGGRLQGRPAVIGRSRRRVNSTFGRFTRAASSVGRAFGHMWRRSLQLRVVVSTLVLSFVVLLILGFVLISQITDRLLDVKLAAATEEADRARIAVERDLSSTDGNMSVQNRLRQTRSLLTDRDVDSGQNAGTVGTFDTVLMVPGNGASDSDPGVGPTAEVPDNLRDMVQAGQVAYQYATVPSSSGGQVPALIVGTPTNASVPGLELYLVFPLTSEQNTVDLVRGTLLTGGVVLLGLLAAIAWLVSRQVVIPVRSASRIAVRFADGRLKERMPVRGEDDMARLAMSFNDMAESLSKQITHLEEFGGLQRQFTSDVSHELRTPLTTVRMASDVLYEGRDDLDPVRKRSVELLDKELDRFETLLNELLEISRHDAGMAELAAERMDMAIPIDAALATVNHLAEETGTELVLDLPTEPVIAEIDPRRVERVLRNLLANAIDHGERRPVVLTMRSDGDAVAITVRDNGIGLRPGEEKLVFNRFWRSDPSRFRRSGGTGLGLAISIEDARLHQGRLEAWGEPGNGACFRLTLPLVRGHKLLGSPLPLKPVGGPSKLATKGTRANSNGGAGG
ncbi:MtrAB system histidine kinase MtrB [Gordonia soli]